MLRSLITGRLLTALAVGAILAIAQLAGTASVTSPAIQQAAYPAGPVTTTEMWLDHPTMRPGEANAAHVKVTSNAGTPQGLVTFRVGSHSKTVALVNGQADYAIPSDLSPGTYKVTARYNGQLFRPSSDTAFLTVTTDSTAGTGNRAAPTTGGGLPATGSSANTGLFALGGLALLGAGAFTLVGYRRRSQA